MLTNTKYIYLAEPIDQANGDTFSGALRVELLARDINWYSPLDAWSWSSGFSPVLQETNIEALRHAECMVAVWPVGTPSVGIPAELMWAKEHDISRIMLTDRPYGASFALIHLVDYDHWHTSAWHVADDVARLLNPKPTDDLGHIKRAMEADLQRMLSPLEARWSGPGVAPQGHHEGDAGYDLTSSADTLIPVGEVRSVQCGICVEMPPGYWALIQGRSSSWKRGLSVKASVIDAGYRGPLWVDCLNVGRTDCPVRAGERIAQLIPMPLVPPIHWIQVDELSPSDRGSNGYGSTGK